MSKPVKNLIMKTYEQRFGDADGAVLLSVSGIKSNQNNQLRTTLAEKGIRVTVVKNTLLAKIAPGTGLESVDELLDGPCALAYGGESVVDVAREVLEFVKKNDFVAVKGAVMQGSVFDAGSVEALSKYPTRAEAISKLAGALLAPGMNLAKLVKSPGENLAGALKGPAGQIAGAVKAVEDKGGEVAKVA